MYYLVIVALCRAMSRLCVIWHPLWPFLESKPKGSETDRSREEILDALLKSSASITVSLQALRQR